MRKQAYLLSAIALMIGGAAAAQERCERETVATLEQPATANRGAEVIGRSASVCGKYWSASNILERSEARRSTVEARFNLAATYAQTGRLQAAADLYRSVVADGAFTRLTQDFDPRFPDARRVRFTASDEAARRLAQLEPLIVAQRASTAQYASNVFAADEAASDVSAIVGGSGAAAGAIDRAHISDAQALSRDGLR